MKDCIYADKCSEQGEGCLNCEYYDNGDYEQAAIEDYQRALLEARLDYYDMFKEYNDVNEEY